MYAAFVYEVSRFVGTWLELITAGLMFLGGWKLRQLKPSGPRWIRGAIWVRVFTLALAMVTLIWMELLNPTSDDAPSGFADALGILVVTAALGFEITALVWLRRHRVRLAQLCRTAQGAGPHGTMVAGTRGAAPLSDTRTSFKAVWGAVLTGLALVLIGGPLALVLLAGAGIGGWELLLLGAPGALCGLGGTVLGWIALTDIRAAQGRLAGAPLAGFAALACPLLALLGITLAVPMFTLAAAGAPGWPQLVGRALLLLPPAGVLTFGLWAVQATTRWAGGQPLTQPRGVLKWVFAGVLAGGLGLLLASVR